MYGFASNFVCMFLGWTPTKFMKIGVLTLFFMELWVILCIVWQMKKQNNIDQKSRVRLETFKQVVVTFKFHITG